MCQISQGKKKDADFGVSKICESISYAVTVDRAGYTGDHPVNFVSLSRRARVGVAQQVAVEGARRVRQHQSKANFVGNRDPVGAVAVDGLQHGLDFEIQPVCAKPSALAASGWSISPSNWPGGPGGHSPPPGQLRRWVGYYG